MSLYHTSENLLVTEEITSGDRWRKRKVFEIGLKYFYTIYLFIDYFSEICYIFEKIDICEFEYFFSLFIKKSVIH